VIIGFETSERNPDVHPVNCKKTVSEARQSKSPAKVRLESPHPRRLAMLKCRNELGTRAAVSEGRFAKAAATYIPTMSHPAKGEAINTSHADSSSFCFDFRLPRLRQCMGILFVSWRSKRRQLQHSAPSALMVGHTASDRHPDGAAVGRSGDAVEPRP